MTSQTTPETRKPDSKRIVLQRLVSLRALCWWVFIYHEWPMRFIRSAFWDGLDAAREAAKVLWIVVRIPVQPLAMVAAFLMDAGIREKLKAAHARKAKRRDPVQLRGTISFG